MTQSCPATVGQPLEAVDTPALLVELDAYERNLARMAALVGAAGLRFRPHAKTHKSPLIALDQIAQGAVGVCSQKVAEAEILAQGGVRDILIANQVVGEAKLARLAALARLARISVCVDEARNLADLSAAAEAYGVTLTVLVEIEVGGGRCGVQPGEPARALAEQAAKAPGLRFGGLQAYNGGAQLIRDHGERRAAVRRAAEATADTVALLSRAGLACEAVTGGGTGTLAHDIEAGVLTELQAGSYLFMDTDYGLNLDETGAFDSRFENSLFVLSTVMSKPRPGLAVVDAGLKALAFNSSPPRVRDREGVRYLKPSDEHGKLELAVEDVVAYAEKLLLIPGHCDPTVNLYDWYVGVRGGRVERVWPVAARGALG
ncbi:MAG: DSD1 family PLP-dependent enzyme [Kiloniellales bacterium]